MFARQILLPFLIVMPSIILQRYVVHLFLVKKKQILNCLIHQNVFHINSSDKLVTSK